MEHLTKTIEAAVMASDYSTLLSVFLNQWETIGSGEQRSLSATFVQQAVQSPIFLPTAFHQTSMIPIMIQALSHLPASVDKAADNVLRQRLFDYMVNSSEDADYAGAARVLSGMRMDDDQSSVYYMKAADRADVYVKIAECFLADDLTSEADAAVNKAGSVVEAIPDKEQHMALILRYKSTYARVLDSNRKFLSAATRYHDLSMSAQNNNNNNQHDLIDADDLLQMMGRAVTCAILAPSGPQRQRVLGHLFRDARLGQLESLSGFETHSTILRKMYMQQIVQPHELTRFEAGLAPHQKAIMSDGLTILQRGVAEHNMVAVGNIYVTIYMSELARILGVEERRAEKLAAQMIMEGSLHGSLDQVEGLLEFEPDESKEQAWDHALGSFFVELNAVTDLVTKETIS